MRTNSKAVRLSLLILSFVLGIALFAFGTLTSAQSTQTSYVFYGHITCDTLVTINGWTNTAPVSIVVKQGDTVVSETTVSAGDHSETILFAGAQQYVAYATFEAADEYAFTYDITLKCTELPVDAYDLWFQSLADSIPDHPDYDWIDAEYFRTFYWAYLEDFRRQALFNGIEYSEETLILTATLNLEDMARSYAQDYDYRYGPNSGPVQTAFAVYWANETATANSSSTPVSFTATPIAPMPTDVVEIEIETEEALIEDQVLPESTIESE